MWLTFMTYLKNINMKTDKNTSLQELFVQMGYDLQVICDEFDDLRNKPTGTIDDYLKQ